MDGYLLFFICLVDFAIHTLYCAINHIYNIADSIRNDGFRPPRIVNRASSSCLNKTVD